MPKRDDQHKRHIQDHRSRYGEGSIQYDYNRSPEVRHRGAVYAATQRPVRRLFQVDAGVCLLGLPVEDEQDGYHVHRVDTDGHMLQARFVDELRRTDWPLRIQVAEGADRQTILALLRKAVAFLEAEECFDDPSARDDIAF